MLDCIGRQVKSSYQRDTNHPSELVNLTFRASKPRQSHFALDRVKIYFEFYKTISYTQSIIVT